MGTRKKARRTRSKPKAPAMRVVEMGNQVWLAGLGALARAQKQSPKLFQSLVEEGRSVQSHTREATEEAIDNAISELRSALSTRADLVRDKATETWDNVEKIFQSRVHKALQQLGVPTAREIKALSRKVDELNRSVQMLSRAKAERRPASRRPRTTASAQQESMPGIV